MRSLGPRPPVRCVHAHLDDGGTGVDVGREQAVRVAGHEGHALLGLPLLPLVLHVHEDHHAQEHHAERARRDDQELGHLVDGRERDTCEVRTTPGP